MDITKFEMLERHIHRLLGAFAHVQAENVRLSQSLSALHEAPQEGEHSRADWEAMQAELLDLRTVIHTLQQERELIRIKLEAMLGAVERLEAIPSAVEKP